MKKQRILSILLSLAMIVSMLPTAVFAMDAGTFKDVDKDAWYFSYVSEVYDDGFMTGTASDEFSPNVAMTRAMFVQSLYKVATKYIGELNPANSASFADVTEDAWYAKAVAWAKEAKITSGVTEDQFGPDLAIQRQEIAVMMEKFVNYLCEQTSNTKQIVDQKDNTKKDAFADADKIADWAKAAVEACRVWGLVAGYPDGEFKPENEGTRAEIATIIANLDLFAQKIVQPTEPTEKPTKPSEPVTDPSEPVTDPSEPVTDPSEPVTDPSEPVTDPSEPVTDPSEPVTDPSEPVTDPSEPVTDPSEPVEDEPVDYIYNALAGVITDVKADVKENGKLVLNKGQVTAEKLLNKTELDEITIEYIKNSPKLMAALGLAKNAAGELVDLAQAVVTTGDGYIYVGGDESYVALTGVNLGAPNKVGQEVHPIDVTYIVDLNTDSFVNLASSSYMVAVENAAKLAGIAELAGTVVAGVSKQDVKDAAADAYDTALKAAKIVAAEFEKVTGKEIPTETIKFVANRVKDNALFCKSVIDENSAKEIAQIIANEFKQAAHEIPVETVKAAAKQIRDTIIYRENHINMDAAKEAAMEIAQAVADRFEGWLGIEIPYATIKAAAEKVLKNSIAAASDAKDYADSYVKNLWVDNFKGENGYYTGDVKFIVNDTVVTVKVDEQTYLEGSKKDAVIDLAVAIAKDLCFDFTSLKDWTYATEIDPAVTVEVLFSAGAYAEDTDNFPYSYPITFELDVEGTIADNLMWKFNRGPFVKFIITERMQNAYDKTVEKVVPVIITALQSNQSGNVLTSAVANLADNAIDSAMEEAAAPMMDELGVKPGSAEAKEVADMSDEDLLALFELVAPAEYAMMIDLGIEEYALAKARDFLYTAPGEKKVTIHADAARDNLNNVVEDILGGSTKIFEHPTMIKYMKKVPTLVEKLKLSQLATFDGLVSARLGNLATALRTETFQKVLNKTDRADRAIDILVSGLKFIPDEASVVINGKTITEETLADIRDAKSTNEVALAVADLIDVIGDVSISDFDGEGLVATVKYNEKYFNFGFALDIE